MNKTEILTQTYADFVPKEDKGRFDHWAIHWGEGKFLGDCDNFVLTLAARLAGGSKWRLFWHLLTFKTVIWHAKDAWTHGGHAILWHRGAGWADNLVPTWNKKTPHKRVYPYLLPMIGIKFLFSALA